MGHHSDSLVNTIPDSLFTQHSSQNKSYQNNMEVFYIFFNCCVYIY